jgi:hypothetical protein
VLTAARRVYLGAFQDLCHDSPPYLFKFNVIQ